MPTAADTLPARLPLACVLAGLAGAVDAIAVLSLGDVFVSFMSGNTTLLGNALAHLQGRHAAMLAAVLLVFVGGVVAGEALAVRVAPRRRPPAVLAAVASCLALAALAAGTTAPHVAVALVLAFAMGVQNAAVRRAGNVDVALTYVTGTLVRLGRVAAAALHHRGPWADAVPMAALWLSFALGAVAGSLGAAGSPSLAMAAAAGLAAALAGVTAWRPPRAPEALSSRTAT